MLHDQYDHVFTLAACKPGPELPSEACREKVGNGTIGCRYQVLLSFQTGSKPGILSRIIQTTASLTRLKPVRNDRSISFSSKIRLVHYLVISIFLYACESWTLTAELQRRIQAMEMRSYRKILRISYKDHVINEEVRAKIQKAIEPNEDLIIVKTRKLQWYGHVFPFIRSGQNHLSRHSERAKKTRQREEEV